MLELKVRPVTLLRKAVAPISIMTAKATVVYNPDGILLQATDEDINVLVVLRINPFCLDYFRCDVEGYSGIDPKLLLLTLDSHASEEWSVTIHGDDDHNNIGFLFQNKRAGLIEYHEMKFMNEVPKEIAETEDLQYEFQAVVGIPSSEFKRILMRLHLFGLSVNVHITDKQVKLSTLKEEIVLTKENGECIIGGVEEDPIQFTFDLQQIASFVNATLLSSTVWILTPVSPDFPCMINYPIGRLGNIMFYLY